jgi:two-component system OmpR family response regulator
MRVLVVDGYPDAAESYGLLLQHHGFETAIATSGEEALAAVERFEPHVIVMDISLGDIDGRELCRHIRRTAGAHVRILVVSGWTQPAVRASTLAAGCDRYFLKPLAVSELLAAIREAPRRPRGEVDAHSAAMLYVPGAA